MCTDLFSLLYLEPLQPGQKSAMGGAQNPNFNKFLSSFTVLAYET